MPKSFEKFKELPPELRHWVWEIALAAEWSCIRFQRVRRRIRIHRVQPYLARLSCREARSVLRLKFAQIAGLGWFNMDREIFFFRDVDSDRRLMKTIRSDYNLFAHIQHIGINARDQPLQCDTLRFIIENCPSLRTIVVVAPWFVPTAFHLKEVSWWCPYEDRSNVFTQSPGKLDIVPLFDAIENKGQENDVCLDEYLSKLALAVQTLPDPLPADLRPLDNLWWRVKTDLDRIQLAVKQIESNEVKIYLRTVNGMRFPHTDTIQQSLAEED